LDLTNPAAQTLALDYGALSNTSSLDLLVDMPLLHTYGLPPIPLHINESGPILSPLPDFAGGPASMTLDALALSGQTLNLGPGIAAMVIIIKNNWFFNLHGNSHLIGADCSLTCSAGRPAL
jgi:hypothetical protein